MKYQQCTCKLLITFIVLHCLHFVPAADILDYQKILLCYVVVVVYVLNLIMHMSATVRGACNLLHRI